MLYFCNIWGPGPVYRIIGFCNSQVLTQLHCTVPYHFKLPGSAHSTQNASSSYTLLGQYSDLQVHPRFLFVFSSSAAHSKIRLRSKSSNFRTASLNSPSHPIIPRRRGIEIKNSNLTFPQPTLHFVIGSILPTMYKVIGHSV